MKIGYWLVTYFPDNVIIQRYKILCGGKELLLENIFF